MTGMKSGAGDDPFADVVEDTDDEADDSAAAQSDRDNRGQGILAEDDHDRDRSTDVTDQLTSTDEEDSSGAEGRMSVDDLPYIARRNVRGESVKTGRDKNVLFELRPEIAEREDEFVGELERRLGTDVPKTDAREAALAAIWDRPELVVPILEEWGLGYFED